MRNKILIFEGAQFSGKTTLASLYRETTTYTNLLRLSGVRDSSVESKIKLTSYYKDFLSFLRNTSNMDLDYVFDRFFFTEMAYSMIGYKDYGSYKEDFLDLLKDFDSLDYDIFIIFLVKDNFDTIGSRDKPKFTNINFSEEESMKQQEAFLEIKDLIAAIASNIKVIKVNTYNRDPLEVLQEIKSII